MAVKLSMSACFSERFLSSAAAAMLKSKSRSFAHANILAGKFSSKILTADQRLSYDMARGEGDVRTYVTAIKIPQKMASMVVK